MSAASEPAWAAVADLTRRLKAQALAVGFSKVGIARAEALEPEGDRLRTWLARGYHATLGWMERTADQRANPARLLPGVKSVVAVALNYDTPPRHVDAPEIGKISRYAWGDDYHDVLTAKLTALLDWIRAECPGANGYIAVDAQPVMDKAWAVRAGLGWLGKHGNVITREFGSWVFLGELLLDIELEPETELVPDHCGVCTACLDACPTQAIVEPYVVDARRCIAFATIESKSETPDMDTHGWVFGCDVCQDVCPWSRFRQPTTEARFTPHDGMVAPPLAELDALTPEDFKRRFAGTPVLRAKHHGLRRNVAAARGAGLGSESD
ncbi:tRNA epoxyqueuosine(34) reductase QueG [Chloracidobacterium validum]|uniref:Epoxyqueuosine reductase n=1 Tax=Chloracidobacterium validum TaxID=2821543 RepID=A0ABX8B8C0_9BACT|nr:tRNA epoxyqueuosine(34) reductase QueG [Chloracidobacterium validum]QUW02301.1 tRNA epoxyqueuosine(34) reductase QueG [Chloracidobacterium validum]